MTIKIDRIDRVILDELQKDGRATNVHLANTAGISAPPCLRRLKFLQEIGLVKRFKAVLDHKQLGFPVENVVMVKTLDIGHFTGKLEQWPQVRHALHVYGEYDFVLTVRTQNFAHFTEFLNDLRSTYRVLKTDVLTVIGETIEDAGVPIERAA